jgi:hypothetical protein
VRTKIDSPLEVGTSYKEEKGIKDILIHCGLKCSNLCHFSLVNIGIVTVQV